MAYGAEKNSGCSSLWEKLSVILLYMLFVDSCLHFYSLCSQQRVEMCFLTLLTLIKFLASTEKQKQKSRHNIAECTQYLYINMCMIDASFENSSCLFSLLNKLTTCYKFCITV